MNETLSGLSFGKAISRVFSKYATFRGRATRSEYWWFYLLVSLISLLFGVFPTNTQDGNIVALTLGLSGIVSLALLLPSLAVGVRRLHDTNRSGWMILLGLIPFVGWIILLVFFLLASDPADNRFGPAPVPAA